MNIEPLTFVLERLCAVLDYEATILLVDEKKEIERLQRELQLIESYFKDIDEVQRQTTLSHVLQTKVQHLIEILSEIEDFLDQKEQQAHESRLENIKALFSCTSNPVISKHNLVKRVAEIREQLGQTLQRPEKYQVMMNNSLQVVASRRRRRPLTNSSIMKDEIIVGLEEDVETLVAKFIANSYSAIVGMGGAGKTTLAKRFYNHKEIEKAFPRRAWVCVSQDWSTTDLLLQICAMFGVKLLKNEKSIPHVKLQEFLNQGDDCLVVLDDVWEKNALQELLQTLLSGSCKVLITTRKENIVMFPRIGACYLHRVRRLTPEQSWELFSRIVDNCGESGSSIDLEDGDYVKLGKEMLGKCNGLPLAVVTLAGLLGSKGTIQQWENIKDRVISTIMEGDDESYETVKKILELSYFDLPYHLKPCFLFLCIYKEDANIRTNSLINFWIEEGFISADQSRVEEAARNYLDELVQRCVVQVTRKDYGGDVIEFQIHDLVRDLCINKANEVGLFQVLTIIPSTTTASAQVIKVSNYRAIIREHRDIIRDIYRFERNIQPLQIKWNINPRLRTLVYHGFTYSRWSLSFDTLKQVRVLCLIGVELGKSAKRIGNMIFLRYLRLHCRFKIENLYFLNKLRNLQSLIITQPNCRIPKLPINMVKNMEQLRVLRIYAWVDQDLSASVSGLANLKNLQICEQGPVGEGIVKELQSGIIYLRVLELFSVKQPHLDAICDCVSNNLPHLETLNLSLDEKQSGFGFDLQKMKWERCQLLKSVVLSGKILKQHESWLCPPKLLSLSLRASEIGEEEDMEKVVNARLVHLRELILLNDAFKGSELSMVTLLPQLQMLRVSCFSNLEEWRITQGSLPKLRQLDINSCIGLKRIPFEVGNIHTLQILVLSTMTTEFCGRLKKREEDAAGINEEGEDFHLVKHIPTITIIQCI